MNTKKLKLLLCSLMGIAVAAAMVQCTKSEAVSNNIKPDKLAVTAQPAAALATTFVHPGILNTQASLTQIASEANANNAERLAAYQKVLDYCNSHSPSNGYKATISVASSAGTTDETNFKGDALLSYALALRWAKTGDNNYAVTVKQILDGWANVFQGIVVTGSNPNPNQGALEAAWAAPTFAAAAEIIKHFKLPNGQTGGWTTAEDNQFKSFLNKLKDNYINNTPNYHNNWVVSQGYAKMAIGIFEDSQTVYNNGLALIKTVIPEIIATDGSMNGEICGHSDYTHFQYSLTGITYAANLAAMQFNDISVYTASNSRLLAGYNYQYKLIKGTVSPGCNVNGSPSSPIWPGIEIADRRYHTTETSFIRNISPPYGLPGGDVGFLGWTSYTHHNVY
ncbi:hypothetical protein DYU05_07165 [Mucilaginibacter terrenus]|uniref:Alginate lyase domain-containing protein n=1 Tax=Mucilaginibacter terrenus TaxID=2482727 RepID=A0A3E2NWY5_9SPHI|nr:alginate lyase family protein [Mucilaginibacter terrenus]RFZ85370.1 hypothetical protein DYU05_07165 [Mucilaginibacter terrenus]